MWIGLAAQTASIVWRSFLIGTEPLHMFFERLGNSFSSGPRWQAAVYVLVFVVPAAAVTIGILFRRHRLVWLPVAGAAVVIEMILFDFLDFTRLPIEKVYEYLSLASWCSALALLAVSPKLRLVAVDAALAAAACLLVVFAAIQPKTIELQLVPALQSYWLFIHVSLASLAYAIFAGAFAVAALFLVKSYAPAEIQPGARARLALAALLAKGIAAALVLALVLSGIALPFRSVGYAPHELKAKAEDSQRSETPASTQAIEPPPVRFIHVVRYGAALLGAFGTAAFVFFWLLYPALRLKEDKSGIGPYVFLVSTLAVFAACLLLAGLVRGQEQAIARIPEEQEQVARLLRDVVPEEGRALTQQALDDDVQRWEALSRQARSVLSARWLPLTLEKHEKLKELQKQGGLTSDTTYQSLVGLYRELETERVVWRLPIRYKDLKQLGSMLAERAAVTGAVARRLSLPADGARLRQLWFDLGKEQEGREANALLPRGRAVHQIAAFVGLALLIAFPMGLLLYFLLPLVADRLPDAARLDRISYSAIAVGYPLFTFGALFAGAIWAHFAWGTWWSWDPKEVGSLIGWVLYTIYLHQRYREGMTPKTAAVAGILGFLACTLSLAANNFLGGLHAYS